MNWDNSAEWERQLEIFEQSKRIADSLERIANYLEQTPRRSRKILTTEMTLTQAEQALLDKIGHHGE